MRWESILIAVALLLGVDPTASFGKTIEVSAGGDGLKNAIAAASPGDILHLAAGKHQGPVIIDKPLTIEGASPETTSVLGNNQGSVIKILAPDITIRRLHILGSGTDTTHIDGGVYVEQGADNPLIEDNWLEGNLFGISLHGPKHAIVRNNRIANRDDLWLNYRGNGIHMWNNAGSLIENNVVQGGRDGIFIQLGRNNILKGNRFEHLRFAIHFMYSKGGEIAENISTGNHVGFALMYSDLLTVRKNISVRDRDYGLLLNSANKGKVDGNFVYGTEDKCLFFYLSRQNVMEGNRFEHCAVGVHATGSDDNVVSGNAFVDNRVQMRYSGTKSHEWSHEERGNYWSDNVAFDLDGDTIADTAYRPNNIVDWIVWRYPLAKLLLSSPAMEILRLGQSQFPALYPGGIVDSYPLMAPPPLPLPLPPMPTDVQWVGGDSDPNS